MFRPICNRVVLKQLINVPGVNSMRHSSALIDWPSEKKHVKPVAENIDITISGQVYKVNRGAESGSIFATINTRYPNSEHFAQHRIFISKSLIDRYHDPSRFDSLDAGQRMYVVGHIQYNPFVSHRSRDEQEALIRPHHMAVWDSRVAHGENVRDINKIQLVGRVVGEPRHSKLETYFSVSTRYTVNDELKTNIHSVRIVDEQQRNIAGTFRDGSNVIINGMLRSSILKDTNEKGKVTVQIEPITLFEY